MKVLPYFTIKKCARKNGISVCWSFGLLFTNILLLSLNSILFKKENLFLRYCKISEKLSYTP